MMYRIRKLLFGLCLVSIFVFCAVTLTRLPSIRKEELPISLSHQLTVRNVPQEVAINKPLAVDETWQKRSINSDDKGQNKQQHRDKVKEVHLGVERHRGVSLKREHGQYFEKSQGINGAGDVAKERVNVIRQPINSGGNEHHVHNLNNRTGNKDLTMTSQPRKVVSSVSLKHSALPMYKPRVDSNLNHLALQRGKIFNSVTALKQFEHVQTGHPPLYQPSHLSRNPSVHSHSNSLSNRLKTNSVRSQPKLPMVSNNKRRESNTDRYRANIHSKTVPIQPVSHRNYSKAYNMYLIEKKKKRAAELVEERKKKLADQNLLKTNCQGSKYCLTGMKASLRWMHDECFLEALKDRNKSKIELNPCECTLLKSTDAFSRKYVGLVSLAGSGNTWLRGLLQKATGVCTASMWCDSVLRAKNFCAEGLHSSLTLAIKNHDPTIRWRGQPLPKDCSNYNKPQFDAVIFLHRDPYEAMVAEWNRALAQYIRTASLQNKSTPLNLPVRDVVTPSSDQHKTHFGKEAFGDNVYWNKTIRQEIGNWETMVDHLVINSRGKPVLVVRYEDLKRDAITEVKKILRFLRFDQVSEQEIESRLQLGFQNFYRNHTDSFDHFTQEQKMYVNTVIKRVDERIHQQGLSFIPLENYIR